ncbi:hypothetical protein LOTGIDRAFT_146425, partial [Lottia gigantea]
NHDLIDCSRYQIITVIEQEFLIDVVNEFKGVLESKQNDIRSIQRKEKAWREIEAHFL